MCSCFAIVSMLHKIEFLYTFIYVRGLSGTVARVLQAELIFRKTLLAWFHVRIYLLYIIVIL